MQPSGSGQPDLEALFLLAAIRCAEIGEAMDPLVLDRIRVTLPKPSRSAAREQHEGEVGDQH
jgi:hypothetical protein